MHESILVVAVHPDDETLGCGGTLLKSAARGDTLHWLLVTSAFEPDYSRVQIEQQGEQVETVRMAYPFDTLHWLKFPTTRLETIPLNDLIAAIREVVQKVRPSIVFTPHCSDIHSDHRVTFQAVSSVIKPFYMRQLGIRRVLSCEVLSETDATPPLAGNTFLPNVFVDISDTLERKLEIMALYQTEIKPDPFPRSLSSIRALARCRGATVSVEYAEAFMLIRELM